MSTLLDDLSKYSQHDNARKADCLRRTQWMLHADAAEIHDLLKTLQERAPFPPQAAAEELIGAALAQLVRRYSMSRTETTHGALSDEVREAATAFYRKLGSNSEVRHHVLTLLAHSAGPSDLEQFAELIVSDPPPLATHAAAPFFPLIHHRFICVSALFPKVLDGIAHLQVAAPILDLANHLKRKEMVDDHPAVPRKQSLAHLLGVIVGRLGHIEQSQPSSKEEWEQIRDKVNESVALAVALCDALALMGDKDIVGKLYQALELGHRRVRTEAAAALARLGEQSGVDVLVELAAEPIIRLRVLAYAEELGFSEKVADQYVTPTARAEAELACFLAEPLRFGISPRELDLVDERTQHWPGFDEPVECYLFRYAYAVPDGEYSNVGIAGPVVYALDADLGDLSPEDIYAAYAGWQTEHDEIFETPKERLNPQQQREMRYLQQNLIDRGFRDVESETLGSFFGEHVLMAKAYREEVAGCVIADSDDHYWYPQGSKSRSLSSADAYYIYKGRRMLRLFNP